MTRISKDEYYLGIAREVLKRGTCLRRNYGAVIVKNDEIIATGYTGAPRGSTNCIDVGECERQKLQIKPGERYELCFSVHAEVNACISASRQEMIGSTLYLAGYDMIKKEFEVKPQPCLLCSRIIINSGISQIIS